MQHFEYVHFPGRASEHAVWLRRDRIVGFIDNTSTMEVVVLADRVGDDDVTASWEFSYENEAGDPDDDRRRQLLAACLGVDPRAVPPLPEE